LGKSAQELLFNIKGQTAIVTGVSGGLGVTYAETLAESGVNLVIGARRFEKLVQVAKNLSSRYSVEVIPVKTDVTQESQIIELVKTAREKFGSLEIIVNNAGSAFESPALDVSLEEWNKVVDVNLTGVFLCARTAAREMVKTKYGKIVNIASIYGAVADTLNVSSYYASKAAVINLTRALAVEWAPYSINVNAIAPAFFPSEMSKWPEDQKTYNHILKKTPLGRPGELVELKGTLIYLASPASNYVTGQTIFVDGGWTAV
jgi:gluconate 5-dehydrogenase